jgi:DnaJ-class molecular chaperone
MKEHICPYCNGKGMMKEENIDGNLYTKCGRCNGTGYVDKLKDVEK